jgi:signal transduction histidine kinase
VWVAESVVHPEFGECRAHLVTVPESPSLYCMREREIGDQMALLEVLTPDPPQPLAEPQGGNDTVRVLHFEDRLLDAERIHDVLGSDLPSAELVLVTTGEEFEQALREHRYDVILATYCSPDRSGLEPLELAQTVSPETPFVFVSEVLDARDASAAVESLRSGAADFIVKQELDRLGPAIERAISEAASAQRQRETSDARRQSQEEFVSRISHDLRTPLTAIKASIGVILANEPPGTPEPLHRMFRNIDLASDQMVEMVANLAELARIEAGFTQLRETECDLREIVQRVGRNAEPLVEKREQRLTLQLPAVEVPSTVDASRIERALANLVNNAMKYGPPQGEIRLSMERDADTAVFSVGDDGPGFPEDQQVFSPDRRAEPSRRTDRPGLGLLISQALVELHGGRIWIDRTVPHGAMVRFALPLPAADVSQDGAHPTV